jgi:hypothetical protein
MTWPPSPWAISLILFVIFIGLLLWREGIEGLEIGRIADLVLLSIAPAITIGTLLVPASWTAVQIGLFDKPLEEALYPGASPHLFALWTLAVAIVASAAALYRYLTRLKKPR